MTRSLLEESRGHLADLLEACQRCAWYLQASADKVPWPVTGRDLADRSKDVEFYERLAAINERFGKLQDLLTTTMRHLCLLSGENAESFLRVASFCSKVGILESLEDWQACRSLRNRAAHAYGTDYTETAGHFNAMHTQIPPPHRHRRASLRIRPPNPRDRSRGLLIPARPPRIMRSLSLAGRWP